LADTLAGDKPIAIGECEILPTADELAAQPRWTFFMAWAELVQSSNSVQPIQDLDNAVNVVTLGQISEAVLRKSATKRPFRGAHPFHAS
jgi:mannan endo-1,4-beta-mannosidase